MAIIAKCGNITKAVRFYPHCPFFQRNKEAIIPPIPTSVHITPPNRVDKIYRLDGSVASFDFQLSVIVHIKVGKMNINSPKRIRQISRINIYGSSFEDLFLIRKTVNDLIY